MNYIFGLLGPVAMLAACVFEFLARRMVKNPRHDKELLAKRQKYADIFLVAAWAMLAAAYILPGGGDDAGFSAWMTWMLIALLVLDVAYLYLRRARPRKPGEKKRFWDV